MLIHCVHDGVFGIGVLNAVGEEVKIAEVLAFRVLGVLDIFRVVLLVIFDVSSKLS
jgi:hypothetical protein